MASVSRDDEGAGAMAAPGADTVSPPTAIADTETLNVLGLHAGVTSAEEVIDAMLNRQHRDRPSPSYLEDVQLGLIETWVRKIVVQFLNELGEDFQMRNDTVGLAVHYFDRFLSAERVDKAEVQLYAVACVLISAKFGERRMPALADLEYVCRGKYDIAQIKAAETRVLECLRWQLHAVTPHAFCRHLIVHSVHDAAHAEAMYRHAEFFIDLSYYEYDVLAFSPCVVGSAALLCSQEQLIRAAAGTAPSLTIPQLADAERRALGTQPACGGTQLSVEMICTACGFEQADLAECRALIARYFERAFLPFAQREVLASGGPQPAQGPAPPTPCEPAAPRDKAYSPDNIEADPNQFAPISSA